MDMQVQTGERDGCLQLIKGVESPKSSADITYRDVALLKGQL